jgi:biopolymer transport protein ExbD
MNGAFNARRPRRRPRINITSLIDVMFLLLIFFMVSSTFREQYGIDITLPEAETASEQDVDQHEIVVTEDGALFFGDQRVDEAGLREAMTRQLEAKPDSVFVLRADEKADFGLALRAMDIARSLGARYSEDGRGATLIIPTSLRRAVEDEERPARP